MLDNTAKNEVMCQSDNQILRHCFRREEVIDQKRPEMAATQFKNSLMKLMEILMSKEPSYVRCIKPNDAKQPAFSHYNHAQMASGISPCVLRRGPIGMADSQTVSRRCFETADIMERLQGESQVPAHPACRFIKGFIYRHEEYCPENEYFLDHVRYSFLKNLRKNLPKSILDKSWPTPPPSLVEASEHLRRLNMRNMVMKYCRRVQPEWKKQMMQKVVASEIFKDQKDSYPQSVGRLFLDSRLEREQISLKVVQTLGNDKVQYGVSVIKYDRRGFKPRPRQLLLTNAFAVLVDKTKIKQRIDYAALRGEKRH
ncbi:Unconventional myosin-Ic [Larimichthys crocea]|uniref:Uncharacterized protein n=1 Tax=Larimichthys crocea TaxID=215358 RepID=A0ACD3R587_LARCR|nr:Unconventional myosin-Ic [Larimichthys crocea]